MPQLRALRRILSNRRVAAAETGLGAYAIVLHGSWVTLMLYAFGQGGVGEAGLVSLVVYGPAALFGPLAAIWFNRLALNHGLAGGLGLQAFLMGLVALAVAAAAPSWMVYLSFTMFAIAQMVTRPTVATILPKIVDGPEELAASNSASELLETAGLVVGPALAGLVLLATEGLAAPFFASAIVLTLGAAVALTIGAEVPDEFSDDGLGTASFGSNVLGGVAVLRRERSVLQLVVLLSTIRLVVGALEVAVVPLSFDQLGRGDATAGFLSSALGVGGLIGAGLSILLIGRRRLTGPIAMALLIASVPLIIAPLSTSIGSMLVLFAVAGLGRPILVVGGRTLLQGLSSEDTLAQLFGFLEGLSILAVAVGSVAFSLLAVAFGTSTALVVTGVIPILILILLARPVMEIDRHRPTVDAELLTRLRKIPIFSTLPAFRLEQLMNNMWPMTFEPNSIVFNEGDHGDLFHVVVEGEAIVELPTATRTLGPGGFFGEIALLWDQPRMATVRAGANGMRVHTLERDVFLAAVSSVSSSGRRASRVVEQRLDDGDDWFR